MKSRSTRRAISIFLATAVITPIVGATAAQAASPGKIKQGAPTADASSATTAATTAAAAVSMEQAEEQCANAATDTRTPAEVQSFMANNPKSMWNIATKELKASLFYENGYFGKGIDIALIDSGVGENVRGLDKGNVRNGPDLSWESQAVYGEPANPALWSNDTFGHGTHLAGIMTGRDVKEVTAANWNDPTKFMGIAPMARTIDMKVADAGGATDVTQVIAAIDWVVKHAHDPGLNIRVINLSYGLNSATSANQDALSYAVQQAWNAGIVVVAAAGNEGKAGTPNAQGVVEDLGLTSPAFNKDIIAVGSVGANGVSDYSTGSNSSNMRMPDFVAWGESMPSLHVEGTTADQMIIDDCIEALTTGKPWTTPIIGADGRFVKASGTSQAAAVTSAVVALLLQKTPGLSPEQVKKILSLSTDSVPNAGRRQAGEGKINLEKAFYKTAKDSNPDFSVSWSLLDPARGDSILVSPVGEQCLPFGNVTICLPRELRGNQDWLGNPAYGSDVMARESVNKKKSPYCLDVSDYVAQTAYANNKCASPYTAQAPTAWTFGIDADGFVYERWNGGPGLFYTGDRVDAIKTSKATPAPMWPMKWPAPAWLGMSFSDFDWSGLEWVTGDGLTANRWRANRLKESDFSANRLRAHDFTANRLRTGDFSANRLRGSAFTANRLKSDDFSANRLKNFGWKDFVWS